MAECIPEVGGRVDRMCQPCLKKDTQRSADVFCSTCNEFQCNVCTHGHTIYVFMKNHKLLSVNEGIFQFPAKDTEVIDMCGRDICEKHNKPFEFYCDYDKSLACSSCAILDHRKCKKVVDIVSVANVDHQCNELREKLQTAITTTSHAVENINKSESYVNIDMQRIPEQLNIMKKTMNEIFDDFAKKVNKDAERYRDTTTHVLGQKKIKCENNIKTMKNSLKTIENIARKGTATQQFITAHSMTETIQNELKNVQSLCVALNTLNVSCNLDEHFDTLRPILLSVIKPDEFEMNYREIKKTKLEQIASLDLKQTGDDVRQPLYTGLDFLPDGRLVVVDNRNGKCLIYDENLSRPLEYKLPFEHPKNVCVVSDEELAITSGDAQKLVILHVSKSNKFRLNRICKVNVKYYSISMKDDNNFVVSTIDHKTPIRIVSMSGEEKDFDIMFPSKKYPIDTSFSTYIRGRDKIVLSDRDADTVYIYEVETDEKVAIKDELIEAPCGLAVGPDDHVFIASKSTSSIVEITPGGRVLTSYQVEMKSPRYIAIFKD